MDGTTSLPDYVSSSLVALNSFLESHVDAEHRVREILDRRLQKIDQNTYRVIFSSLQNYLGKDAINVLDYVAQMDQDIRLQEVVKYGSPQAISFLEGIISLYGPELANAYLILDGLPNNWNWFYRDVHFDQDSNVYFIRIRLAKNNGEEPIIEGYPSTMLELATNMIRTLQLVKVRDSFDQEAIVDQFVNEAKNFIKFLKPPTPKMQIDQPQRKPEVSNKRNTGKSAK